MSKKSKNSNWNVDKIDRKLEKKNKQKKFKRERLKEEESFSQISYFLNGKEDCYC